MIKHLNGENHTTFFLENTKQEAGVDNIFITFY